MDLDGSIGVHRSLKNWQTETADNSHRGALIPASWLVTAEYLPGATIGELSTVYRQYAVHEYEVDAGGVLMWCIEGGAISDPSSPLRDGALRAGKLGERFEMRMEIDEAG